mgnify:CR=1 FL=1
MALGDPAQEFCICENQFTRYVHAFSKCFDSKPSQKGPFSFSQPLMHPRILWITLRITRRETGFSLFFTRVD